MRSRVTKQAIKIRNDKTCSGVNGSERSSHRNRLRLVRNRSGLSDARWIRLCQVLAADYHPRHSIAGIAWTVLSAAAMFALAAGKACTGRALGNPVLRTEGPVTAIDGILAVAVLAVLLSAALGWWWADPAAGYVLVFYAAREARGIFSAKAGRPD